MAFLLRTQPHSSDNDWYLLELEPRTGSQNLKDSWIKSPRYGIRQSSLISPIFGEKEEHGASPVALVGVLSDHVTLEVSAAPLPLLS